MAAASSDPFDAYFKAADLNQDGRISGSEAVSFFKGSNLSQQVLAQIWNYADPNRTGFLGRPEFYNALRLVTVAQTGRTLTPDIVNSALFTPAGAKIPPPRINLPSPAPTNQIPVPSPAPQNPSLRPPMQGLGQIPTTQNPQNPSFRPPVPTQQIPSTGLSTQLSPLGNNNFTGSSPMQGLGQIPSPQNPSFRPPVPAQQTPSTVPNSQLAPLGNNNLTGSSSMQGLGQIPTPQNPSLRPPVPTQHTPSTGLNRQLSPLGNNNNNSNQGLNQKAPLVQNHTTQNLSTDWFSGKRSLPPAGPAASPTVKTSTGGLDSSLVVSGNGISALNNSASSSADPFASLAPSSTIAKPPAGAAPPASAVQLQQPQMPSSAVSSVPVGPTVQAPWPKITQSDIQKYTAVFVKVDRDRDGKITGEEARNLFLSWRLPREVLRKVWELSDQDKDGMLSFREFCMAVYLMERHRENRALPDELPAGIWSDGISLPSTGQFSASHPTLAPHPVAGYAPQGGVQGSRGVMMGPSSMKLPPRAPQSAVTDGAGPQEPPKSKIPVLEKHSVDQLSKDEQTSLSSKFQEASDADKKVQELEKEIMDAKAKVEFYRAKMQELILYKSRCDNRLNEISERVSADKNEVVTLAKKYEDKCKQVGDVASKLTIEEATFRDIQEKKMEIYNAILKLQKGEKPDDSLQERANKVQSNLEELVITLNEQCKTYGLRTKPTTITELPFGWQPGIQETADEWDEEWDKFGDDGFAIIKELTVEIEKPVKEKNKEEEKEKEKEKDGLSAITPDSNGDSKMEGEPVISPHSQNNGKEGQAAEDTSKSVPSSPAKKSPKKSAADGVFHDNSPRASESVSDHERAESSVSGDNNNNNNNNNKYTDEHLWGPSFDHTDDADSSWNFNSKDEDLDKNDDFFSSANLFPIKTGSSKSSTGIGFGTDSKPFFDSVPGTPMSSVYGGNDPKPFFDSVPSTPMSNIFGNKEQKLFFDSVPSTPMYNSGFSPRFSEAGDDHSFDNFSNNFDSLDNYGGNNNNSFARFDSFRSTSDFGSGGDSFGRFDSFGDQFGGNEKFSRFDSMRSSSAGDQFGNDNQFGGDYNQFGGEKFSRFDSMSSTTNDQFGVESFSRFDSMRSSNDQFGGGERFARFDSIRSTSDYANRGFSFDDNDPYGAGPFKFSDSQNQSPRHGTDNWSAF